MEGQMESTTSTLQNKSFSLNSTFDIDLVFERVSREACHY